MYEEVIKLMSDEIKKMYNNSNSKDKELIVKLLILNPYLSKDKLTELIEKYNKYEPEINSDSLFDELFAITENEEIKEFVNNIRGQISELPKERFLDLLVGIKRASNGESIEDYVSSEYNRIMNEWHNDNSIFDIPNGNSIFDIPNGVITIAVNGEVKHIKVGEKEDVNENSLYDIASMTKLYTEVILFRMIKEKKYGITFDLKLSDIKLPNGMTAADLYPKLPKDMTIRELLEFNNNYKTDQDMDIRKKTNREDGLTALRTSRIIDEERGQFLYTDLPIMILTDILEQMTGKRYQDLLKQYIINPLGLENTFYMELSLEDQARYTGLNKNGVNDPKANIMNGGGHAGVITDANDLIKFLSSIFEPGFIFDSNMDPMLLNMLGLNRTVNRSNNDNGKKIRKIIEELKGQNLDDIEIKKIINNLVRPREPGISKIGNLNTPGEWMVKIGDFTFDSVAPQTLPFKGFLVQGSTRVQGDTAEFIINNGDTWEGRECYITATSILLDIHNQYENFQKYDEKKKQSKANAGNSATTYEIDGKGTMKSTDARMTGLGYFGGYQDKLSNMVSIARIMEIYRQSKGLVKQQPTR